jgi:quercetin dioxygenase-like cupin family protein
METRLAPGEETLLHSHPIEAAVIFLTDARLRISNDDGSAQEESIEQGDVAFGASAIVHRTANIGERTARVVTVEIFSLQPPVADAEPPTVGEALLDNAKARLVRIQAMPRHAVSFESPSPAVIVAETDGVLTADGRTTTLAPGDTQWCEPGRIELDARTESPFRVVVVMLKSRS